jgi:hypothetical protein
MELAKKAADIAAQFKEHVEPGACAFTHISRRRCAGTNIEEKLLSNCKTISSLLFTRTTETAFL